MHSSKRQTARQPTLLLLPQMLLLAAAVRLLLSHLGYVINATAAAVAAVGAAAGNWG
jgi:sensor domain CHASE-containing protein